MESATEIAAMKIEELQGKYKNCIESSQENAYPWISC